MIGRQRADSTLDLYATLQVSPVAEDVVIHAAYRALIRRHHPDRGGTPAMAQRLNAAYAVLRDARARQAYDRYGTGPAVPAGDTATEPEGPRSLAAELGRGLLERFAPTATEGPGWLFDFAGVLRVSRRDHIWMKQFHRRDLADARAFNTMIEATLLTRPLLRWGSDLFVAVLTGLSAPFAGMLRAPRGPFPRIGHAVVALDLTGHRLHAPRGCQRLPTMMALGAVVQACR